MTIYDYKNYKKFITDYVKKLPNRGRGAYTRLAEFINISPVIISQVLNTDRDLSLEQSMEATEFFGLNDKESKYFLKMVEISRAGSVKLKKHFQQELSELLESAQNLKDRLEKTTEINDEDRAIFYSSWHYAAIHLYLLTQKNSTAEQIAHYFSVSLTRVKKILDFLKGLGMVTESGNKYQGVLLSTHLSADSPFVACHHNNWRKKALTRLDQMNPVEELFLSSPMSINKKDATKIRKILVNTIDEINKICKDTKPEELKCLNISWFNY